MKFPRFISKPTDVQKLLQNLRYPRSPRKYTSAKTSIELYHLYPLEAISSIRRIPPSPLLPNTPNVECLNSKETVQRCQFTRQYTGLGEFHVRPSSPLPYIESSPPHTGYKNVISLKYCNHASSSSEYYQRYADEFDERGSAAMKRVCPSYRRPNIRTLFFKRAVMRSWWVIALSTYGSFFYRRSIHHSLPFTLRKIFQFSFHAPPI